MNSKIVLFVVTIVYVNAVSYEGESCVRNGMPGSCKLINNCPAAIEDLKRRINPQICSFDQNQPIVCCAGQAPPPKPTTTTPRPPVATTPKRPASTTEYVPPVYDYSNNDNTPLDCEPIPSNLTAKKTGQKAFDKCVEYQQKYIFPCKKAVSLGASGLSRQTVCLHSTDQLIIGGEDAGRSEFPHMALLGYGDDVPTVDWQCAGSIISETFILTAGHCAVNRDREPLSYALVNILRRSEQVDASHLYRITQVIKHPEYRPPHKYNDIALARTERSMKFDQFTLPTCLPVGNVDEEKALATGWGATEYRGPTSDILQKVVLFKFATDECSTKYPANRLMRNGFDRNSQTCYGDKTKSKDTCQGDSGGPLTIRSSKLWCMYEVVGVTSFGKQCGILGEPGVYTRVAHYVPWIEGIVWPN